MKICRSRHFFEGVGHSESKF